MNHYLDKPDTPEELLHFGVKGMKWGVKKGSSTSGASGFEASGKTKTKSHHRDTFVKGAVATAAVLAAFGPVAMQSIAIKAEKERGRAHKFNPDLQFLGVGKEAKPNRKGVHKITSI